MKKVFLMAMSFLLTACAFQMTANKPGAGQPEFSNDFLECRMLSRRIDGSETQNTITTCMQGKGWQNIKTSPRLF